MERLKELLKETTANKIGLEIGGKSPNRCDVYSYAERYDNVIFSSNTMWSSYNDGVYNFYEDKKGKVFVNDATNLDKIEDKSYDFVYASHTLEHVANPIKALYEFKRVVKDNGYIIMILPEKSYCFDHNRPITPLKTLIQKYEKNVGEDDLSCLIEILKLHDLSKDPYAGTYENFTKRSLNNLENRCLHHHVFNEELIIALCVYIECKYVYSITDGCDIWFIMKKE